MDATANDIPPQATFRVQGSPTLKFRPAGSSEFVDYNGDRSLESLVEFVESNKVSKGEKVVARDEAAEEEWEEEDDAPEHDEL
jgi:protein disulfide-isomerase A1